MVKLQRHPENPIFIPKEGEKWEEKGTFNASVAKLGSIYHLVYRAFSSEGTSVIGHAIGDNFVHFTNHEVFIKPDSDWDKFGCEDPRVTEIDGNYYIFYTGLSKIPLTADAIKLCLAKTTDFKNITKYPVTTFNSKAMGLFPSKINGKYAALLTVSTDRPPLPAKIALAYFDQEADIWSSNYWNNWFDRHGEFSLPLQKNPLDQVELGAAPIKTDAGWIVIYSYIKDYFTDNKVFGVEAALLDLENPLKILGRSSESMISPQEDYEIYGEVPRVVFPSGAFLDGGKLWIYYGAADSTICLASCAVDILVKDLLNSKI